MALVKSEYIKGVYWELYKGERDERGFLSGGEMQHSIFKIAPHRVNVIPKLRIAVQDTFGGKVVMPWIDPESQTNIGSIDIVMEGASNTYVKGKTETGGEAGRREMLGLYKLTLDSFMKLRNGVYTQDVWELVWVTPFFRQGIGNVAEDRIVLLGYILSPMTISEVADNPWLSSWTLTFTIWGGQIDSFLTQLGIWGSISR